MIANGSIGAVYPGVSGENRRNFTLVLGVSAGVTTPPPGSSRDREEATSTVRKEGPMRPRFAVLASLLAALTALAAPTAGSAAPKHNRGLTINVTPDPILAGDPVLIYGQRSEERRVGKECRSRWEA